MPHSSLIAFVEHAFAGVVLGRGIGLQEANAIDSRKSPEARRMEREKDEERDWRKVVPEVLNRCYSSYHWLDADGLRFYLPAMMVAELSGLYGHSTGDRLAFDQNFERFDCFTQPQREAVIVFLNWCLSEGDYCDSERHQIMEALLNGYWKDI